LDNDTTIQTQRAEIARLTALVAERTVNLETRIGKLVAENARLAILPTTLAQKEGTDLVFVQAVETAGSDVAARMAVVDNSLSITKLIYFWSGNPAAAASSNIDTSFTVLIVRSTLTPPTGAPY
jgi:diphthamide synthase (EF-2-diphthine--ammonia ligase)